MTDRAFVKEAAQFLQEKFQEKASLAIVLGSGLGNFVDSIKNRRSSDLSQIPHFPKSTVSGHEGNFVWGKIEDVSLFILQGRVHYYEGHDFNAVTFPIRVLKELNVKTLVVTNAAGIVRTSFKPGELMLIKDHINLMGHNPLRGENEEAWGPRFPDMSEAYDKKYLSIAKKVARTLKLAVREGVYEGVNGPSYETPAEIKMLKTLGADAVGMSTVPEVIVANHQEMKVLGISCLSNYAAHTGSRLSNQEVLDIGKKVSEKFGLFLKNLVMHMR